MIAKAPGEVVVDVHGVGYRAFIPLTTYYQLPDLNGEVVLHTVTHVREDAIHLYAFLTQEERRLFTLLTGVSGIGPRLATNILSGITTEELVPALSEGDLNRLKAVPGVGKKTAERLILELREKVKELGIAPAPAGAPAAPTAGAVQDDVASALENLGYGRAQAARAAGQAADEMGEEAGFEKLIRRALKVLAEG
jgi:Holliday junction DNA helicase RuvA